MLNNKLCKPCRDGKHSDCEVYYYKNPEGFYTMNDLCRCNKCCNEGKPWGTK